MTIILLQCQGIDKNNRRTKNCALITVIQHVNVPYTMLDWFPIISRNDTPIYVCTCVCMINR